MGTTLRYCALDQAGHIKKFSWQEYQALSHGQKAIPAYAGELIRMAEVVIELKDRKPFRIIRTCYFVSRFNAEGFVDPDHSRQSRRVAMDGMGAWMRAQRGKDILDSLQPELHSLKHRGTFNWEPTAVEMRLIEAVCLN